MGESVQTPRIFMGPLMSLDNRWAKLSEQLGPGLTHALIKAVLFTAKLVDVAFPPKIEPHFSGTSQLYHNFETPMVLDHMWIEESKLPWFQVCPGRVGSVALLTFSMHALQWAGSAVVC